ncbi:MAG: sugar ABC transporter permease [Candidatus Omnitrophica bacterium]|nr:sugar ABC transporter permease [Candidatus Omnitrophota bacterium]
MNLKSRHRETLIAYLFLSPNLLGFLIFTSIPVLVSLSFSFFDSQLAPWPQVLSGKFVGFGNFVKLLGFRLQDGVWLANDPKFWKFTGNTLFLMMVIPFQIFGSLVLALIMNQKIRGIVGFRTIYFLPTISNGVAIYLLWQWVYNPNFGLLNSMIAKFGEIVNLSLKGPHWLSNEAWAKPSLMIMGLWVVIGGHNAILYLAALQNIPKDFYDAASIDGANLWQKFWYITWPMISPTTFFITIMAVIFGFQSGFMQAYIMTRGGPNGATTTLEYYIFNNLYEWHHVGYAATIAWFLFIVIFVITLLNWRFGGKLVNY